MTTVRLVDLDVFKRYSLAIRQETAPAEEVLALLETTRRQVIAAADPAADPGGPRGETAHGTVHGGIAADRDLADADWGPDAAAWEAEARAAGPVESGVVGQAEQQAVPDAGRPARRRVRRTAEPPPAAGQ